MNKERNKKRLLWVFLGIAAVLISALLFLALGGYLGSGFVKKNPDVIAVPGYEMLELKANTAEQSLRMPNPPQNCCFFQISLYLEDGTLLWQSELIEPGAKSKPIVLTKTLEKGLYPNAVLRYSCYRMDETLAPLNGAETKLTLNVK